jgi:hypothetical protein
MVTQSHFLYEANIIAKSGHKTSYEEVRLEKNRYTLRRVTSCYLVNTDAKARVDIPRTKEVSEEME